MIHSAQPSPVTKLADLLDLGALERQIGDRLITRRRLAGCDIAVLNYTAKATYRNLWTTETRRCRGLVVDGDETVLARPFEKFFDLSVTRPAPNAPFVVTEKLDGSLGILYPGPDGLAVTTRGDPNGWQSSAATALWRERHDGFAPPEGVTLLFEIILPENRVVIDYGTRRDLVLLAAIDIASGLDVPLPVGWDGPVVERIDASDGALDELMARSKLGENKEGFVLFWPAEGVRAKVKLAEYRRLHRMIFATSTKSIWQSLAAGRDPLADVADGTSELLRFVETHTAVLRERQSRAVFEAHAVVTALSAAQRENRRSEAEAIKASREPGLAFLALDGREAELAEAAWRTVRPARAEMFKIEGQGE